MTMAYTRALSYQLPFIRGEDVLKLQRRLHQLNYVQSGQIDGIFGLKTAEAVKAFQQANGLTVDGIVGPLTWDEIFSEDETNTPKEKILTTLDSLLTPHNIFDGISWSVSKEGISIEGNAPEDTGGEPKTVERIWKDYGDSITHWSEKFGVPAELIVATICTETRGDPAAIREEPGYISDTTTPNKVSPGIMQTLISTAQDILGDNSINRDWLLNADNGIRAGTAYIASQWKKTDFDPPKVACAYNAGGIYKNEGENNRWKMRQYPINSSEHADRFVKWYNDCVRYYKTIDDVPGVSFTAILSSNSQ